MSTNSAGKGKRVVSLGLATSVVARIDAIAKRTDRSRAYTLRQIVLRGLEKLEAI